MNVQTIIDRSKAALRNTFGNDNYNIIGVGNNTIIYSNGIKTVQFNSLTGSLSLFTFEGKFI